MFCWGEELFKKGYVDLPQRIIIQTLKFQGASGVQAENCFF